MENLEKMLANAPQVAQWWETHRKTIEVYLKRTVKRERRINTWMVCLASVGSVAYLPYIAGVFSPGLINDFALTMLELCVVIGLGGFFGAWGAATVIERRSQASLAHHYKQADPCWRLVPSRERQEFSQDDRAKMVKELSDLGVTPHHIVALRDLDLPNSWWHAINEEVGRAKQEQKQTAQSAPTLEEVFVQVENHAKIPTTHVLRL